MNNDSNGEDGTKNVPAVAGVWTDEHGTILKTTANAAELLGRSQRALVGRSMVLFLGANREHALQAVARASRGHNETLDGRLLPFGRRRVAVRIHLQFTSLAVSGPAVLWALERLGESK
jgi:hypothetical protein